MSRPVVCDHCGNEMKGQGWFLTPPKSGVDPYLDFCSPWCIAGWATELAVSLEAEVSR